MRWPWRQQEAIGPRPVANRALELQTAKEILAEVFHTRPGEVDEMIRRRLEERSRPAENIRQEKREEGRWPATFCLGD
jgi:hypothetical protein